MPAPMPMATGRFRPARPGPFDGAGTSRSLSSTTAGPGSDFQQFGFLGLQRLVDLLDVPVRRRLELFLRALDLVLAGLAVAGQVVERLLGVPPDVADRDPALLRLVAGDLDEVAAAVLGALREDDADDGAVTARVDAEVAVADRLLDRTE